MVNNNLLKMFPKAVCERVLPKKTYHVFLMIHSEILIEIYVSQI